MNPQVIRNRELLRSIDHDLKLPKSLVTALQIPLMVNQQIRGNLVFGEMRHWERAPFTGGKIERALERAKKLEDYMERKFSQVG
ncbi:MAG: hypothetical protein H8D34_19480 [Chloroflexi bacterium]|nr:hypothetical protein [Chloroflexota bacterium]